MSTTTDTVRHPAFSAIKLRRVLLEQGRRIDWFTEKIGYSQVMVSKVLNGHFPMSERFAVRAAVVLGIAVEDLMVNDADTTPEAA